MSGHRRAQVQPSRRVPKPWGTIEWWEHEAVWAAYAKRYGTQQSAERINERGGFGYTEVVDFLGHEPTTWEPA